MKPTPNPGPYLLIAALTVMIVAAGGGYLLGLGKTAVLAAMIAVYCLLATFAGALGPDLRRMAWLGPVVVVASSVPRFLGHWHYWAGVAGIAVVLFAVAMFPAAGSRFRMLSLGVSYTAIAGYGMALPDGTPTVRVVWAAMLGLAVALVLRLAIGAADPRAHTREQIAAPLTAPDVDTADIIRSWLLDRPSVWTSQVLAHSLGYRSALETLSREAAGLPDSQRARVGAARERLESAAAAVAAAVVARSGAADGSGADAGAVPEEAAGQPVAEDALPASITELIDQARDHLAAVRAAATERDETPCDDLADIRRRLLRARWDSTFRPESGVLSEATTKAVGVFAAAGTGLPLSEPVFANTYFNAVVAMLQPTWSSTLQRVVLRLVGCLIAAVLVLLTAIYLPGWVMHLVALGALFTLLWFITTRPLLSTAGGVAVSIAVTADSRHLDPLETLATVTTMLVVASAIVLVISVPAMIRANRVGPDAAITAAVRGLTTELDLLARSGSDAGFRVFVRAAAITQRLRRTALGWAEDDRNRALAVAGLIDALVLSAVLDRADRSGPQLALTRIVRLLAGQQRSDVPASAGPAASAELCARQLVDLTGPRAGPRI